MRFVQIALVLTLLHPPLCWAQTPGSARSLSDVEIRKILADRIDVHRQSVGMVVGIVDADGRRIVTYGRRAVNDPRPLDGDTIFEIGSITKVFTSLLLADAVERKEMELSDSVTKYLPATVKAPQRGRPIELQDLANHTAALPLEAANFSPKDMTNPYVDYSVEKMYEFLSNYELSRDVGTQYEYSNFGVGLLGHILARHSGSDYEALIQSRVAVPLGMHDTAIALTPAMRERLASGHSQTLSQTENFEFAALAGAGALRSNANDMLTFLSAAIGLTPSPLAGAMARMLSNRWPADQPRMEIGLGWHVFKARNGEIVWHNGGTGGYRTFIGYSPVAKRGVVILSNTTTPSGPDDIGRHLLDSMAPLRTSFPAPPVSRTAVTVDPAVFDRYVGRYQFSPIVFVTVMRDGNRFMIQLSGQPAYEIFAESETKYFLKIVDAQLTFEPDSQGKATAVVLRQNGLDQRAIRVEKE